MNKSQLFKNAHKIARETVELVGDYRIAFSLALKNLYNEKTTEQKLIEAGCSVWEKYGKKRIYINVEQMSAVFGLTVNFYNTGNISSAYLQGEKISNRQAYRLLENKMFFDCVTNKMVAPVEMII